MDGRQNTLVHSLQFRLTLSTALAIVVVAIIAGGQSYGWARQEASELQDEQLVRLTALVNEQKIAPQDPATPVEISSIDPDSHFVVQWLGTKAQPASDELTHIPMDIKDGFQTHIIDKVSWRILVKTLNNNDRILVAQQTEVRDEFAAMSTLDTLIPLMALLLLLTLMLSYLIRQVFAPLKKLAAQLDSAQDSDLQPLSEAHLAREISPFVLAINRLLLRVNQSMVLQRQFVRDAAHELRSPLTSISLQAEHLIALTAEPDTHQKLVNLHKATERTRILIEQLLTMARAQENNAETDTHAGAHNLTSLKAVLRETLEDVLPQAEAKHLDIAVVGEDISVNAHAIDVQIMVKNLIDNAIRYTPQGGKVEIVLASTNTSVQLTVKDSGPGIAPAEQTRVFDPFYRVPGSNEVGSGLGLFIVKTIADRLGLGIELINKDELNHKQKSNHKEALNEPIDKAINAKFSGLAVTITFPKFS